MNVGCRVLDEDIFVVFALCLCRATWKPFACCICRLEILD